MFICIRKEMKMSERIDRSSSVPLNKQLEEIIRGQINQGIWKPRQKIPSERMMCSLYEVSHITAHAAISSLVADGVLYTVHGKGTYVAEKKVSANTYMGIVEQVGLQDEQFCFLEVLSFERCTVNSSVYTRFGCTPETEFFCYKRLSGISGQPFGVHTSYVPVEYCPDLTADKVLKYHTGLLLEQKGHCGIRTAETLEVVFAMPMEAKLLDVPRRFPLFLLENMLFDTDDRMIYFTKISFSCEAVKLHFEEYYPEGPRGRRIGP